MFADNARVEIVGEPRGVHRIAFFFKIRKLAGDRENLQVHCGAVHVAQVVVEAAQIGEIQLHLAHETGEVARAVQIQAVEVFRREIVRVNVDSHRMPFSDRINPHFSQRQRRRRGRTWRRAQPWEICPGREQPCKGETIWSTVRLLGDVSPRWGYPQNPAGSQHCRAGLGLPPLRAPFSRSGVMPRSNTRDSRSRREYTPTLWRDGARRSSDYRPFATSLREKRTESRIPLDGAGRDAMG